MTYEIPIGVVNVSNFIDKWSASIPDTANVTKEIERTGKHILCLSENGRGFGREMSLIDVQNRTLIGKSRLDDLHELISKLNSYDHIVFSLSNIDSVNTANRILDQFTDTFQFWVLVANAFKLVHWDGGLDSNMVLNGKPYDALAYGMGSLRQKTLFENSLPMGVELEHFHVLPSLDKAPLIVSSRLRTVCPSLYHDLLIEGSDEKDSGKGLSFLPYRLAAENLAENGLLDQFAGDSLFRISKSRTESSCLALLSRRNRKSIPIMKTFLQTTNGLKVHSEIFDGSNESKISVELRSKRSIKVQWVNQEERIIEQSKSLSQVLLKSLYEGDSSKFESEFSSWLKFVIDHANDKTFDMIFANVKFDGQTYRVFDQEWSISGMDTIPLKEWIFARNFISLTSFLTYMDLGFGWTSIKACYDDFASRFGIKLELVDALEDEARVQVAIYNGNVDQEVRDKLISDYVSAMTERLNRPLGNVNRSNEDPFQKFVLFHSPGIAHKIESIQADRNRVAADRDLVAADRDRIVSDRDLLAIDREKLASDRDQLAEKITLLSKDREMVDADRQRLAALVHQYSTGLPGKFLKLGLKIGKMMNALKG